MAYRMSRQTGKCTACFYDNVTQVPVASAGIPSYSCAFQGSEWMCSVPLQLIHPKLEMFES